ncbi:MAG: hypothetical protein QOE23_3948 [Pseudonocardiales bacterium]|jgi:hypothetical protein|nr:hypothetical protein [Pseudonocardiales bacterium]
MYLIRRFSERDRGLAALRRAVRTAIIMPSVFAIGVKVLHSPDIATFAAFGSFAMLLLVDFGGPLRDRAQAQLTLAVTGAVLVTLGTLASRSAWLAAAAMAVIGFGVLFSGVVSSVLAGATTSLLLAFILPVSLPAPASAAPDRLAGWVMASAASLVAITLLWPAPVDDPLRRLAVDACRALGHRLQTEAAFLQVNRARVQTSAALGGRDEKVDAAATTAVTALHRGFLAMPYRPTGLSTSARAVVRLVDELNWLNGIVGETAPHSAEAPVNRTVLSVKAAAAAVLDRGADLLEGTAPGPDALHSAMLQLELALAAMERDATVRLPVRHALVSSSLAGDGATGAADHVEEFLTSLDPSFRGQKLAYAVSVIGRNIDLAAAAERRSWWDRLLGRQPPGIAGTLSAAQERAAAHVERHSVWLHNSVRGAIGLGLAVLVANRTGVQHSFWVVLGTLSVLRSSAVNTGQNVLRALLGTVAGFIVGAILLVPIGSHATVLWMLLPLAILFAGVAPAVNSLAAGQAAFTIMVVVLFNIVQPAGWRVGLLRIEDIAIGCGVSLFVGLLFWPRGAGAALSQALSEAYTESARYLADAVAFGMERCDQGEPPTQVPTESATRAAAASRRLDDTFRNYLAEQGAKPLPLSDVTSLVTGAAELRLAGDAVLELWQRDDGKAVGDRAAARHELLAATEQVRGWYFDLAASFLGHRPLRDPLGHDKLADGRLVEAVRSDLSGQDGRASATAVRVIWTGDHLDAARRLQATLIEPARAAATRRRPALLSWAP